MSLQAARNETTMDVYKIVITVIALVIVTLLSVLAEVLGNAQEMRRGATLNRREPRPNFRREKQQDETIASTASQTRVDGLQNRESSQPEARQQRRTNLEQRQ